MFSPILLRLSHQRANQHLSGQAAHMHWIANEDGTVRRQEMNKGRQGCDTQEIRGQIAILADSYYWCWPV